MTSVPTPPRLAAWIARRSVHVQVWQYDVLGDLYEEFAGVAAERGPAVARRWFWRQALRLAVHGTAARGRAVLHTLAVLFFIGDRPMSTFMQEVRYALRSLRRQPGVTTAIVLTLAIGLGVNAAIFNAIDSLLLTPFPFKDVKRTLVLSELTDRDTFPKEAVSPANFIDIAAQATVFDHIAAFEYADTNLSGGDRPERVSGYGVSTEFFSTLGITPALGRFFTPDDMVWGRHHEIVLGDALWRERFGADPSVVGRAVQIDGEPSVVIGVAPPAFTFPDGAQLWSPLAFTAKDAVDRDSRYLTVFGRLAPGRTEAEARAELTGIYHQLQEQYPDAFRGGRYLQVWPFNKAMVDIGMPTILGLWQAAALFVLLIGCTNIVNLLLAQGAERQRELSVRMAIGAGRARIVRQLLIENMAISLVAVPAALGVAWVSLRAMTAAMPPALLKVRAGVGPSGGVLAALRLDRSRRHPDGRALRPVAGVAGVARRRAGRDQGRQRQRPLEHGRPLAEPHASRPGRCRSGARAAAPRVVGARGGRRAAVRDRRAGLRPKRLVPRGHRAAGSRLRRR